MLNAGISLEFGGDGPKEVMMFNEKRENGF